MNYYRSWVMTEEVATWHKMNSWYDGLCVSVVRSEMLVHPSVSKIIYISWSASSSFTPTAQPHFTTLYVSHLTTKAWVVMIHTASSNSPCECLKDEYEAPIMQLSPQLQTVCLALWLGGWGWILGLCRVLLEDSCRLLFSLGTRGGAVR